MKQLYVSLLLWVHVAASYPPENILSAPHRPRKSDPIEERCERCRESAQEWWGCAQEFVYVVRRLPAFLLFLEREEEKHEREQALRMARNQHAFALVKRSSK